jgi:hypothetical protein
VDILRLAYELISFHLDEVKMSKDGQSLPNTKHKNSAAGVISTFSNNPRLSRYLALSPPPSLRSYTSVFIDKSVVLARTTRTVR